MSTCFCLSGPPFYSGDENEDESQIITYNPEVINWIEEEKLTLEQMLNLKYSINPLRVFIIRILYFKIFFFNFLFFKELLLIVTRYININNEYLILLDIGLSVFLMVGVILFSKVSHRITATSNNFFCCFLLLIVILLFISELISHEQYYFISNNNFKK
jgi:hypothetical protein